MPTQFHKYATRMVPIHKVLAPKQKKANLLGFLCHCKPPAGDAPTPYQMMSCIDLMATTLM